MDVDVVVVPEAETPAEVELSPAALDAVSEAVAEGVTEAVETLDALAEPAAGAILVEDLEPEPDVVTLPRAEYDDLLHRVTLLELAEAQAAEEMTEAESMPPPPREEPLPPEDGTGTGSPAKSKDRGPGYGSKAWYGGRAR